jgi:flagellin
MASMINTNISSLNAQRNLTTSQSSLATSLQRLSTGLRINSAKDDSAGMAIASRMTAQIGGMQQASRNANDGISMSQTAEGAMGSVNDILLRMRDLSVQAANGSNSTADRGTIQNEVDQLYSEIDRISGTTEFNGNKLLDGSATNNSFQIGANANQTISFAIKEVSTKAMSLNSTSGLGDLNSGRTTVIPPTVGSTELVINGTGVTMAATDITAKLKATAINAVSGTSGVSATAYNSVQGNVGASGITAGGGVSTGLVINGANIDASASLDQLVTNINKQAGGVTASIGSNGQLSLTNDDGSNIAVTGITAGTGLTTGTYSGYLSLDNASNTDIKLTGTALSNSGFNSTTGASSVNSKAEITVSSATASGAVTALTEKALSATDNVKINGFAVGASGASAGEKAAAINAISANSGVTATASTTVFATVNPATAGAFTINGTSVTAVAADDTQSLVTKINAAGISGVTASTDTSTGKLKLVSSSGNDIVIGNTTAFFTGVSTDASTAGSAIAATEFMAVRGSVTLSGKDGAAVRIEGTATSLAKLGVVEQGGNSEAIGGKLSVTTQANAQSAITRIDKAISFIAEQRSTMGAVQNRLSTTISNLASATENISAARSRIQDADFASETASLTRGQILQQAGTAMLAQANSLPNGVLALLRG